MSVDHHACQNDRSTRRRAECVTDSQRPGAHGYTTDRGSCGGSEIGSVDAANEMKLLRSAMNPGDGGGYGQCVYCNAPIDSARLNGLPYVVLCLECADDEGRLVRRDVRR